MPALPAPPELVVARAVVVRAGRVLLLRRAAWDTMPSAWELPGGKVDPGEACEVGLARELREETGLVAARSAPRSHQLMRSPSGRLVLERCFDVEAWGVPTLSDEHDAFDWYDLDAPLPLRLTPASALALRVNRRSVQPPAGARTTRRDRFRPALRVAELA